MHEISGQDEEKGHMERKADRQNNLGRAVWYEQVCLNGTVSQYHSQNGYALGNIEKSNTLYTLSSLLLARSLYRLPDVL